MARFLLCSKHTCPQGQGRSHHAIFEEGNGRGTLSFCRSRPSSGTEKTPWSPFDTFKQCLNFGFLLRFQIICIHVSSNKLTTENKIIGRH